MQTRSIEKYRSQLTDMREQLRSDITAGVHSVQQSISTPGDVSQVPTHAADHDVEGLDSAVAVGALQQQELDAVMSALDQIDAGTYGRCARCGGEISASRLDAVPYANVCSRCARATTAK